MGWRNKAEPHTKVPVMKSTHGQTYITWPPDLVGSIEDRPGLPIAPAHSQSRQWVLADRTAVLILNGDPQHHMGGVIRHTFDVVEASWNRRKKTLVSRVKHPSDPEITFLISTSGVGCSCTQGAAGNAGPIGEPYDIVMTNPDSPEFDWYEAVPL
jgi:hypothetical protein